MGLGIEAKKRFLSDTSLPITVLEEPYFTYYIELYDKVYNSKQKYAEFLAEIEKVGSEAKFIELIMETRKNIIDAVQSTQAFIKFNEKDNPDFAANNGKYDITNPVFRFTRKSDVYDLQNVGKYFLSIDLAKANFQMLKKYDKNIIFGANSYVEFMKKFTDIDYIINSKWLREYMLSFFNSSRIMTMEKYYTHAIIKAVTETGLMPLESARIFTHDEIVFNIDTFLDEELLKKIEKLINEKLDLDVHVEQYKLVNIADKPYFVKEMSDGSVSFKCVAGKHFAQAYKKYFNMEIEEKDLVFYHEKELVKYVKPSFL